MLPTTLRRAAILAQEPAGSTAQGTWEFDTVREWILWMTEVEQRIGSRVPRRDLRRRVRAYLRGLLSPVERKNGWQLAEVNGDGTPYGVQHLLGRAKWDAWNKNKGNCHFLMMSKLTRS